jgi:hypothetical protein
LTAEQKVSGRLTSQNTTQDRLDIRGYLETARKARPGRPRRPAQRHERRPMDTTYPGRRIALTQDKITLTQRSRGEWSLAGRGVRRG